jgi:hypothetical protein
LKNGLAFQWANLKIDHGSKRLFQNLLLEKLVIFVVQLPLISCQSSLDRRFIKAAAELSNRYIQDRFLPDKAIDLLDETGSKKNLTIQIVDPKTIDKKLAEAEQQKSQASQALSGKKRS